MIQETAFAVFLVYCVDELGEILLIVLRVSQKIHVLLKAISY